MVYLMVILIAAKEHLKELESAICLEKDLDIMTENLKGFEMFAVTVD